MEQGAQGRVKGTVSEGRLLHHLSASRRGKRCLSPVCNSLNGPNYSRKDRHATGRPNACFPPLLPTRAQCWFPVSKTSRLLQLTVSASEILLLLKTKLNIRCVNRKQRKRVRIGGTKNLGEKRDRRMLNGMNN